MALPINRTVIHFWYAGNLIANLLTCQSPAEYTNNLSLMDTDHTLLDANLDRSRHMLSYRLKNPHCRTNLSVCIYGETVGK